MSDEPPSTTGPALRVPRPVPPAHALEWYREAMRLWKRGPVTYALLALIVLALSVASGLVPFVGVVITQLVVPLAACGLQYASLAADRGERPRIAHAIAILAAPPSAMATVIVADLIVFAAEAAGARAFVDVDLVNAGAVAADVPSAGATLAIYGIGLLVSLPLTFVPFAALFDACSMKNAFAQSLQAFGRNPGAMLLYGALSFVLLMLALATAGIGLILVLPWFVASAYAAWKDIFAVTGAAKPG